MANHILLPTQFDLPCLRNVVRLMMSFGNMEGLAEKVKILVNRVGLENGQITLKKAEETIGKEIFWQFPNDYRTMIDARNNGVPLIDSAEGGDYPVVDRADQISFERRNPPDPRTPRVRAWAACSDFGRARPESSRRPAVRRAVPISAS